MESKPLPLQLSALVNIRVEVYGWLFGQSILIGHCLLIFDDVHFYLPFFVEQVFLRAAHVLFDSVPLDVSLLELPVLLEEDLRAVSVSEHRVVTLCLVVSRGLSRVAR